MVLIETLIFTEQIIKLVDDASYADLQKQLAINPEIGDLVPGTKGLRKVRWKGSGRGKRAGSE